MNSKELEALKELYRLTPATINAILSRIINKTTKGIKPTENPKAVILGAQPGSGKTLLETLAFSELKRNAVICNSDNLRDFHPAASKIKREHEQYYPAITGDYSNNWALGLQKFCRENKLNYILETTLSNGGAINNTIAAIKKHGFTVDLKVLAVNGRLSMLGTYSRLEEMRRDQDGVGRMVSKQEHDKRYNSIQGALKEITDAKLYSNLYIYGRTILTDNLKAALKQLAVNPEDPLKIYMAERSRTWGKSETEFFSKKVKEVIKMMESRGASRKNIEQFKEDIGIQKGKTNEIEQ